MKKKIFFMILAIMMMSSQVEAINCTDATFAINTINNNLREWKCTPLKIWYAGDDVSNTAENVAYLNELATAQGPNKKIEACMIFYSDFHSPKDDGKISAWNYDSDYHDWSWYFGRDTDGEWHLITNGY